MDYLLIKWQGNWADEMDLSSLWVTTVEEYENWYKEVEKIFKQGHTIYIGSNQEIHYKNFNEFIEEVETINIGQIAYDTLINIFDNDSFGILNLQEVIVDWDSVEYEDD